MSDRDTSISEAAFREALERAAKVSKPWRCAECGGGYPCVCRIEASLAKEEEAQVSAMPERVEQLTVDEIQAGTAYIIADPTAHKVCNWMIAFGRQEAESRLLAAEARVREVGQNAEQFRASMYALEERVLTLRAERDALVPLLRYFLAEFVDDGDEVPRHDCGFVRRPESGYCEFHDKWVQAQAILAREAGE